MRNENLSQEDIEALLKEAQQADTEVEQTQNNTVQDEAETPEPLREEQPVEDLVSSEAQEPVEAKPVEDREPSIRVANFEEFEMEPVSEKPVSDMGVLMDIPLSISVELGRSRCYVKDLLNLTVGSIVELDRLAGDPVDVLVNGKIFAKGEVVVIDENFGVRIQEILSKDSQ